MNFNNHLWILTTDTLVGLGCFVKDNLLDKLFELKKRPMDKKIIILVGSIKQAQEFSQWSDKATKWAQKNWPGAKSVIVNNQGFRMPDCQELCEFLNKNGAMYVTSANVSGQENLTFEQAKVQFKNINNYLNCCKGNKKPSSVYDLELDTYYRK